MFAASGGGMQDQAALLQNIDGQAAPACMDVSAKTTTRNAILLFCSSLLH